MIQTDNITISKAWIYHQENQEFQNLNNAIGDESDLIESTRDDRKLQSN